MKEVTDKRKEIESDLIKVLRDFDDDVLYEIAVKYSAITTKIKGEEAKKALFEEKSLIKKMMSKEIDYHKSLLEEFKTADETRKKEICDTEYDYLRSKGRILDGDYLFEIIKIMPKYAIEVGDLEKVDGFLRWVESLYHAHRGFDDRFYDKKHFILQDLVLDLLKKDIDLGREDLVKKHIESALDGFYGFLAKREEYIEDMTKPHSIAFTKSEYLTYCDKYRKSIETSKLK